MQNTIKLKIETLSNLFIGGAPLPFEIGGIDQQTIIDREGFPYIPGSSIKGALRAIVRENDSEKAGEISGLYAAYLQKERETNKERIRQLADEEEAWQRILKRYDDVDKNLSAEYLFGIEGFNNTPKLIFSDLILADKKSECFSVDMKNSIDTSGDAPVSNPRTYKAARGGLVFEGEIRLYKIELLGEDAVELCKSYVIDSLMKFNSGVYRLGNSKSRGYGKVRAIVESEDEGVKI
ncbi:MAG TPA: RAMP superfamily CRISPR-associated protein [Anaerovoracaceae bacterium]|nr:RAMP superfamily CRISPR-associated protein [Anaerovoracaceae bacterium]